MNTTKRAAAVIAVAAAVGLTSAVTALATGNDGQVCTGLTSGKIDTSGDPESVILTASPGHLIDSYCVKAGSVNNGLGPRYLDVDPPKASITITYTDSDGKGRAISHYSWHEIPILVDPTPSPTPSESNSPSPSPSPSESTSPSPSPSPSESTSPSPSPSPSESTSPSPSPSPSESSSPSPSPSGSTSPSPSPSASASPFPTPSRTTIRSLPPTAHSTVSPPATVPVATPEYLAQTGSDWPLQAAAVGCLLVLAGAGAKVLSREGAHRG